MSAVETPSRPHLLAILALLVAPYLVNDFANIYVHAPVAWLACDYGSRLVSLATVAWLLRRGFVRWGDFHAAGTAAWRLAGGTLVATAGGIAWNSPAVRDVLSSSVWPQLGYIPAISPPWLERFDYFGGIALVAASEELIFRGVFPRALSHLGASAPVALLVSAVAFGLAHWSLGLGSVLLTTGIGLLFGAVAQFCRSLWPVMVAHYVVDLVAFS